MTRKRSVTFRTLLRREKGNGKVWRHPGNSRIVVAYKCAAVIALMQMGISDYELIAKAVGLEVETVRQIDAADDGAIRSLAVAGIPNGEFFKLRVRVQCTRCNGRVDTAPCVFCAQQLAK